MLDDRKSAILRAVVEDYIQTAQPVGSASLARVLSTRVSPATIRNEMAALEREGYLDHPHTSAGRIPTDKGYRFFVDHITPALAPAHKQRVQDFFTRAHGELEEMLFDVSRLLSDLTTYAALVLPPPREAATVRSVQVVGLGGHVALVVAVLSDGAVDKAVIDVGPSVGDERLAAAGILLSGNLSGRSLPAPGAFASTGDEDTDRIISAAQEALNRARTAETDHLFVGGAAQMAATFDAIDTVRRVLAIVEQQYVVVGLLREAIHDDRLSVAIGAEHGVEPLAECSLVVAPFEIDDLRAGRIGVLGPTRMDYPQAMAAVALVSQRLGLHLRAGA